MLVLVGSSQELLISRIKDPIVMVKLKRKMMITWIFRSLLQLISKFVEMHVWSELGRQLRYVWTLIDLSWWSLLLKIEKEHFSVWLLVECIEVLMHSKWWNYCYIVWHWTERKKQRLNLVKVTTWMNM